MSRIHEALKKAEGERAAALAAGAAASPSYLPKAAEERGRNTEVAVATEMPVKIGLPAPSVGTQLKFADILEHCSHPAWQPNTDSDVISNPMLNPQAAEQFRTLRSRLYQLRANQPLSTLLITSSLAREGKTFVTTNLAQAIVRQSERRVLIIDADLRRSQLHVMLGAPISPGLSDYLRGEASEIEIMQHGQGGSLFLIPSGSSPAHPSELLSNGRLKTLLERVSTAFDWILIDAPPCLPVADANILADFCDGLLLVVKAGSTPGPVVQRAGKELRGRNVVGVVLNSVEESRGYGPYYSEPYGHLPAKVKQ